MKFFAKIILPLAIIQSIIATLGSLFFSEIMHFVPCTLCWYQRICMYPLVAILAVGYKLRDKKIYFYALPLSLTGLGIAVYHNLLLYNVLPESNYSCRAGISCTVQYINWFGFITIPLLSLIAFTVINICLVTFILIQRNNTPGK